MLTTLSCSWNPSDEMRRTKDFLHSVVVRFFSKYKDADRDMTRSTCLVGTLLLLTHDPNEFISLNSFCFLLVEILMLERS